MASIANRLAETGTFWSDAISGTDWHFNPDVPENIKIGHFEFNHLDDLIALGDLGIEKTIATSLAHATDHDEVSHQIKRDIRHLSASAGYPSNMVYSTVNDLFGRPDSYSAVLGERLGLDQCYIKVHKQEPGQIWPLHIDNYHAFRSLGGICNNDDIRRFMFALNDWCWGQVFQLGNAFWSNWKAGDFVEIAAGVPHSSANASPLSRYSLVVTGTRRQ